MTDLRIEYEWQDPGAARGAELRATWARLAIYLGDQCATRVLDQTSRSVRDGIYGPLYPLAEWLLVNWWALFEECGDKNRQNHAGFRQRHELRSAMEGYALPDLRFIPSGRTMQVQWYPRVDAPRRVEFLQHGAAAVDTDNVADSLQRFLQAVIERLQEQGVTDTFLQQEWKAMASLQDSEQQECRRMGALGLDPYDFPAQLECAIQEASQSLPQPLQEEFFKSAQVENLGKQVKWVQQAMVESDKSPIPMPTLAAHRRNDTHLNGNALPWEVGYRCAQQLRSSMNLQAAGERLELRTVCGNDVMPTPVAEPVPRPFHGLVNIRADGNFGYFIPRKCEESFRFAFCRGLFEYLFSTANNPALLTTAESERQGRNRAFAAELLAPADGIRKHLEDTVVTVEDVENLAQHFQVSMYVIQYQIKNQRLAEMVGV